MKAKDFTPALYEGYKIYPEDLISKSTMLGTILYVDAVNGSDNYDGLSAESAYATIQKACDNVKTGGTIFVFAPRGTLALDTSTGYVETVTTPAYVSAAGAAHVQLIGIDPTGMGVLWKPASATDSILTIRSPFWRVSGFRFEPGAGGNAIKTTRLGATSATTGWGSWLLIDNNMFEGNFAAGSNGIDIAGAPFSGRIINNVFQDLGGKAIYCSESGVAQPFRWRIENNDFIECINCIDMNPRGFWGSEIRGNTFALGGTYHTTLVMLDNIGGKDCIISDNYFGCTEAEYTDDSSTNYVRTSGNDVGVGNYASDGPCNDLISS